MLLLLYPIIISTSQLHCYSCVNTDTKLQAQSESTLSYYLYFWCCTLVPTQFYTWFLAFYRLYFHLFTILVFTSAGMLHHILNSIMHIQRYSLRTRVDVGPWAKSAPWAGIQINNAHIFTPQMIKIILITWFNSIIVLHSSFWILIIYRPLMTNTHICWNSVIT